MLFSLTRISTTKAATKQQKMPTYSKYNCKQPHLQQMSPQPHNPCEEWGPDINKIIKKTYLLGHIFSSWTQEASFKVTRKLFIQVLILTKIRMIRKIRMNYDRIDQNLLPKLYFDPLQ